MRIRIEQDQDPIHPRKDWDNLGTILYTSTRYILGDKRMDAEEIARIEMDRDNICLPVYAYMHGGTALNTTGFCCPFDSGKCGIIYVSKEAVRKEWHRKRISPKLMQTILHNLRCEIETYSNFLSGEVYGYIIEDDEGNELDSCWGIFGYKEAEREAEMAKAALEKKAA